MVYLLAGLLLLLVVWAVWRYATTAPPRAVARVLVLTAVAILLAAAIGLAAAGQARLAIWPGLLIIPLLVLLFRRGPGRSGPPVASSPGDADVSAMTREEAAEILGVAPDAGHDEIVAAHARQRALREADGASRWATARIDRARDVLLGVED